MNNNTGLKILTLGGVRVQHDHLELTGLLSNKAIALLVYLAYKKQPQSRLHLAELFWPDRNEEQALSNLRTLLTRLRAQLDEYLVTSRNNIVLDPARPYWLDVNELELGLSEARPYFSKFNNLSNEIAQRLERAVELYRGDFLAGFYLNEAGGFDDWAHQTRESLHQQVVQALNLLANSKEREGDYDGANDWISRLLEIDPLQEEAHRRRMLLLVQGGQSHAALNHYKVYQRYLARELDIAPEAQTTDLYEQIKKDGINSKIIAPGFSLANPGLGDKHPAAYKVSQLKRVGLFADTPEHLLVRLAERLEDVRYRAGEVIFEQGELGECMYIIAEGQVRVHVDQRTINTLSSRDIFGEMAVLDSAPRLATVTALTDTLLWRLEQATLYQLMSGQIEVVKAIIHTLSKRLRERVQDVVELDTRLRAIQNQNPK